MRSKQVSDVSEMYRRLKLEEVLNEAHRRSTMNPDPGFDADFAGEDMSFHGHPRMDDLVKWFWQHTSGEEKDHLSLELGSGIGTWSLHMAAGGIESYGVEKCYCLVEEAGAAVSEASERGILDDEDICQYTTADVLESGHWDFGDRKVGIDDATIIYANFPRGEVAESIVKQIASDMDEQAIAVIPDGGYRAREQYFEKKEDVDFVYELDSRP